MLKVLGGIRGGRRPDCLRAASFRVDHGRAGVARIAMAGVLRRYAGILRRCPTDALVPVGSFAAVLQTPVSRRGPSASSSFGPPRGDCFPRVSGITGARLGTQRGNRMEAVVGGTWKPNGNNVETSWKQRGNHMYFYLL